MIIYTHIIIIHAWFIYVADTVDTMLSLWPKHNSCAGMLNSCETMLNVPTRNANMSIMSVLQWCDVWNHRWQGLDMLLLVHRDATLELCTTIAWSAKDSRDLEAIEHENCNGSTSSWVQQTKTQVDSYFFGTLRKSLWMVGLSGCLLALIAISWDTTERCAWTISLSDLWYVISILWNAPQ